MILNVGVGAWHPRGTERLGNSLAKHTPTGTHYITWTHNYPPDSPTHSESNYAFKSYAFQWAIKEGFDIAIWMDSSMFLKKDLQPIIDVIQKDGHFLLRNGWTSGEWCCDNQLEPLGLSREEALQVPLLIAGLMGFDLRNKRSLKFLNEWHLLTPHFSGEWTNTGKCSEDQRVLGSRHDQTFASVISHRLGMEWLNPQGWFDYDIDKDAIVVARGM